MNRTKKLGILLGVLVFVCIATFGVTKYESKKEQIKNSDEIILSLPADTVTAFSWEYDGKTFAFHKDESWLYDGDENFPVDQDVMADLLADYENFGVAFIIEDVEDYAQYGLSDPECTINISTDSEDYEISLGDFSNMDQQRYVSIGDGNVYLVNTDPLDKLDLEISDMIKHDETPSFKDISKVIFTGSENYSIFYSEENSYSYCEDDCYFTTLGGKTVPLDTDNVESYTDLISNLSLSSYVTYNATEEELRSYGLDEPQLTVTVNYTGKDDDGEETELSCVISIGRDPEELKAAEETAEEDTESEETVTAYVRVGDSKIVYKLSSDDYNSFMAASYNDLRHKDLFTADLNDMAQIDIVLEGETHTITAEHEDDETTFFYGEEEIDITNFRSQLKDLEADSFTEEEPTGKEEISVTFTLNDENGTQIAVVLYRYDGDSCLATVDGETVSLISRSNVVDFIEAVNSIILN